MRLFFILGLCFVCFVQMSMQATVEGKIVPNMVMKRWKDLPYDTRAKLSSKTSIKDSPVQRNGQFSFANIESGTYHLRFESVEYDFAQFHIIVNESQVHAYYTTAGEERSLTTALNSASHPITARAVQKHEYLQGPRKFSLFRLLKSPMMLLSLASVGLVFILPKMSQQARSLEVAQQEQEAGVTKKTT
ncbi:ER membrane protein complex subunit Emc7 [Schizosaccharomyces osmophilus]|uniref:ER membrane protein complex subunit Emc7 n=1 Tax=Schizosaccharomyces osmophilus TaxID=2545709 RepID=A0AAE9W716_9SCHI|nr:ER membrane protein complex subunit Emc7 [Schizosaccharomyces osmophilus]WBW71152.1 ER membrane protein complex subunit Emc7 [Schizosaccharomyces osmophilus]